MVVPAVLLKFTWQPLKGNIIITGVVVEVYFRCLASVHFLASIQVGWPWDANLHGHWDCWQSQCTYCMYYMISKSAKVNVVGVGAWAMTRHVLTCCKDLQYL